MSTEKTHRVIISFSPAENLSCMHLCSMFDLYLYPMLKLVGFRAELSNHCSTHTPGTLVVAYYPGMLTKTNRLKLERAIRKIVHLWREDHAQVGSFKLVVRPVQL